ncbi:FAD-binding oxidoreductase [Achromobacter seleniivolatilans]|uniref:FAD-binding oxidoreductase n=1 Tax=Achromobacter seleniivolatilans TaxID=3047478 RepID=A0ABY9M664_9BURK|nr:FAD-binding oxidoreductase [Achromobacter sp. R39]WMD22197.1 FAD-binding oxidoreductase [Achromobacter sp. R39]
MTDVSSDYVIVGAGIFGASLAWTLATAGHSVTLLERHEVASGASGGPGHRGVRANNRDLRELPLAVRALQIWPTLTSRLGTDSGFQPLGGLSLGELERVGGTHGRVTLAARAAVQNAYGARTEILDAAGVREKLPDVSDKVIYALYSPNDGIADHNIATRAFAQAAVAQGVTLIEGANVSAVQSHGVGNASVVLADGRVYRAERAVVLAANTQVPKLLNDAFGIQLPIWSFNPQVAQLRVSRDLKLDYLINHSNRTLSIKRADADHITVTGGAVGRWDDETETGNTDLSTLNASLTALTATFPKTSVDTVVTHLDASRADSSSVDQIPVIDRVPGHESVLYATGWSGHGFAIGPAVAEAVAAWLTSGERPEVLAPFAAARFKA